MTAYDGYREHGRSHRAGQAEGARLEPPEATVVSAPPLWEDQESLAGMKEAHSLTRRARISVSSLYRKGPEPPDHLPEHRHFEETVPRHIVEGAPHRDCDQHRIGVRNMV